MQASRELPSELRSKAKPRTHLILKEVQSLTLLTRLQSLQRFSRSLEVSYQGVADDPVAVDEVCPRPDQGEGDKGPQMPSPDPQNGPNDNSKDGEARPL